MKARSLSRSPALWATALIVISFTGMGIAILLTKDPRWMEWHMSRLGEGRHLSSVFFNLTLILSASLLAGYGQRLIRFLPHRHSQAYLLMFWAMGLALTGVAVFPFDEFHILHNVFGYLFFVAAVGTMLWSVANVREFSRRSAMIALFGASATVFLMALHHLFHFTTLLTVELIGQFFFFAWLLSIAMDVERRQKSSRFERLAHHAKIRS